jgi:hypothetical protein
MNDIIAIIALGYLVMPMLGIYVIAIIQERKHLERLAKETIDRNRQLLMSRGRR